MGKRLTKSNSKYLDAKNHKLQQYENTGLNPGDIPTALEMCKIKIALDNLREYQALGTPAELGEMVKISRGIIRDSSPFEGDKILCHVTELIRVLRNTGERRCGDAKSE